MRMKTKIILTAVIVAICLIAITWWDQTQKRPYAAQQKKLAEDYNVRIEDYRWPLQFPVGYFYTILKPGMTVDEVHNIVRGYVKSLNCGWGSEIYYYYSSDDSKTLRFEIYYDNQFKYSDIMGEDYNSSTLSTNGCWPGLIER